MKTSLLALAFISIPLTHASAQELGWQSLGHEWAGAVDLSVDVDDTARLGGTLICLGPRYVGAAAAHEALQQNPGAIDFTALRASSSRAASSDSGFL